MQNELAKLASQQADLSNQISMASEGRQENADRMQLMKALAEAEALNRKNEAELEKFKEMDPDLFDAKSICLFPWNTVKRLIVNRERSKFSQRGCQSMDRQHFYPAKLLLQ